MNERDSAVIESYGRLKNLKLVGEETQVPWQTVYVILKKHDVPVCGDKLRYGDERDRFAARAEADFLKLIPFAEDMNRRQFQAKHDFKVGHYKVDVKASNLKKGGKSSATLRWAFSSKKQEAIADFMVCLAYRDGEMAHVFLIPKEVFRFRSTISVSERGGKWWDYEVSQSDLREFFEAILAA